MLVPKTALMRCENGTCPVWKTSSISPEPKPQATRTIPSVTSTLAVVESSASMVPAREAGPWERVGVASVIVRHPQIGIDHVLVVAHLVGRAVADLAAVVEHGDAVG